MFHFTLALLTTLLSQLHLRTTAGRSHQARVMGDNASTGTGQYASACFIGVTADSATPSVSDTVLAGEITTGTLKRAQAMFAHTEGTNLYTLTKTFTADQTVTIRKIGVFNAPVGGTLVFETLIDPVDLRSGDQVQISEAITLG